MNFSIIALCRYEMYYYAIIPNTFYWRLDGRIKYQNLQNSIAQLIIESSRSYEFLKIKQNTPALYKNDVFLTKAHRHVTEVVDITNIHKYLH